MKYKQLKDLPFSNAGAIWHKGTHSENKDRAYETTDVNELADKNNICLGVMANELVEQSKDFFEAFQDKPERVKKVKKYFEVEYDEGYTINEKVILKSVTEQENYFLDSANLSVKEITGAGWSDEEGKELLK